MSTTNVTTIRLLVAIRVSDGGGALDTVRVLAYEGQPEGAGFAFGDDLTMGEGEFCDGGDIDDDAFAEFSDIDGLATGLWIVEWDWTMAHDEEAEADFARYGKNRWLRPTLADLVAFEMLPAIS